MKNQITLAIAALSISVVSCKTESETQYREEVVYKPTQGVIVDVKEVQPKAFRITDEKVIDAAEKSLIAIEYIDETKDTLLMSDVELREISDPKRSAARNIARAGMLGFILGRPLTSGVSRAAYNSTAAYNKSNTTGVSSLKSTATTTTRRVKVPKSTTRSTSRPRSTRSYGG